MQASLRAPAEGGARGGILADEMGLGKTCQLIALLLHDRWEQQRKRKERRAELMLTPPVVGGVESEDRGGGQGDSSVAQGGALGEAQRAEEAHGDAPKEAQGDAAAHSQGGVPEEAQDAAGEAQGDEHSHRGAPEEAQLVSPGEALGESTCCEVTDVTSASSVAGADGGNATVACNANDAAAAHSQKDAFRMMMRQVGEACPKPLGGSKAAAAPTYSGLRGVKRADNSGTSHLRSVRRRHGVGGGAQGTDSLVLLGTAAKEAQGSSAPEVIVPAAAAPELAEDGAAVVTLVASGGVLRSAAEADDETGATLVLCPTSLLPQWADELLNHAGCREGSGGGPGRLQLIAYHGGGRAALPPRLNPGHVVLTSYGTLMTEWAQQQQPQQQHSAGGGPVASGVKTGAGGGLLRVRWRRVVLDEAQAIEATPQPCCNCPCTPIIVLDGLTTAK